MAAEQKAKQANQILMSSATGGGGGGSMLCDSGTESDDEELEMLDSRQFIFLGKYLEMEDGIKHPKREIG